jgi:hypothetical protein
MYFHTALAKFKYTERNHLKEYQGDPGPLRKVLIVHIWQDFYQDNMSPWVLSSIHVQRLETFCSVPFRCVAHESDDESFLACLGTLNEYYKN